MGNWFDLHLHSTFSDGRLTPEDLIRECKKAGMKVVALTDHENTGGVSAAMAEGKRIGVRVIPGAEFSVDYEGAEHHIQGLFIGWQSPVLRDFFREWAKTKKRQIEKITENLQNMGFVLTMDDVLAQTKGSCNRSHIAQAVVARLAENKAAMEKFGLKDSSDVFNTLLREESPGFVARERPMVEEVINLIQWLDGIAVWAHPNWKDDLESIKRKAVIFRKFGLDCLEVAYSLDYQTAEQMLALHQIAQGLSMMETAGSDFHSFDRPVFNKIGNFELLDVKLNLPAEVKSEAY